jgi:hypothetical protein
MSFFTFRGRILRKPLITKVRATITSVLSERERNPWSLQITQRKEPREFCIIRGPDKKWISMPLFVLDHRTETVTWQYPCLRLLKQDYTTLSADNLPVQWDILEDEPKT